MSTAPGRGGSLCVKFGNRSPIARARMTACAASPGKGLTRRVKRNDSSWASVMLTALLGSFLFIEIAQLYGLRQMLTAFRPIASRQIGIAQILVYVLNKRVHFARFLQ